MKNMKKLLVGFCMLFVVVSVGFEAISQVEDSEEVAAKKTKKIKKKTKTKTKTVKEEEIISNDEGQSNIPSSQSDKAGQTGSSAAAGSNININNSNSNMNTNSNGNNQNQKNYEDIQVEPTTTVEAAPLKKRGTSLKEQRMQVEEENEQALADRLEAERIKDEQTRLNRIVKPVQPYGNGNLPPNPTVVNSNENQPMQNQMQSQEVNVNIGKGRINEGGVQGKKNFVVEDEDDRLEDEKAVEKSLDREDRFEKREHKNEHAEHSDDSFLNLSGPSRYFLSVQTGVTNYIQSTGVNSNNLGAGLSFGAIYPEGVIFEGGLFYSSYVLNGLIPTYPYNYGVSAVDIDMNQYNFLGQMKYRILNSRISPVIGVAASLTYRNFSSRYVNFSSDSDALDLGFIAGLEAVFTPRLTLGFDVKYMKNVYTRNSSVFNNYSYSDSGCNPIEKFDYLITGLNLRFNF